VFQQPPSQIQLVEAINSRARQVEQLQANIRLEADGMPKLRGTLQLERPDRLRLKAGLMGVSELGVDLGSNSELFWVWAKAVMPGQTPAIYFARHSELRRQVNRAAIPIEPQWIFDALGLSEFGPDEQVRGPYAGWGEMVTLVSTRPSNAGPITRTTLVDPKTASIYQQAFYDSSNRLIAYADAINHRRYDELGISLPHRVELVVLDAGRRQNRLVVETGDYKINALYGDPDKMWSMPAADGVPRVNLTAADAPFPTIPSSLPQRSGMAVGGPTGAPQ
jgi:hypothetical protein